MFNVRLPHERMEWLLETNGNPQSPLGFLGNVTPGQGILAGGLLSGVTSLIGGGKQASAATQAAQIQANAALQSAALQQQRFEQVAGDLGPYMQYGQQFMGPLGQLTGVGGGGQGVLNAPLTRLPQQWSPTMANLANMPGYQFQLQQGLLAAQANEAQAGLGRSGAAMKAAGSWASGLAASNWQSNWQQFLQQQNLNLTGQAQTYNMLTGGLQTGLSAAGALGGVSVQNAANIGNALQSAGAAQAGGIVGAANAATGGLIGASNALAAAPTNMLLASVLSNQAGLNTAQSPITNPAAAADPTGTGLIPGTDQPLVPSNVWG